MKSPALKRVEQCRQQLRELDREEYALPGLVVDARERVVYLEERIKEIAVDRSGLQKRVDYHQDAVNRELKDVERGLLRKRIRAARKTAEALKTEMKGKA